MRAPWALAMAIVSVVAVGGSGCAATIDAVYLIDSGRYTRTTTESRPLDQTVDQLEYEAVSEPDGALRLACFARTRQVQRTWQEVTTYRYRGSYGKTAYQAAALLDVMFGGVVAGVLLAVCMDDDKDVSCWNMLYAAPFALDLGYSGIRYLTARTPILIDKSSTEGTVGLVPEPVHEQETGCESLASLWLGSATGPDSIKAVLEQAEGAGTSSPTQGATQSAIEIVLDPTHTIALTPEVAERWALSPELGLFAVDRDGALHAIVVNRCALLRPLSGALSADAQAAYQQQCLPKAPQTPESPETPESTQTPESTESAAESIDSTGTPAGADTEPATPQP